MCSPLDHCRFPKWEGTYDDKGGREKKGEVRKEGKGVSFLEPFKTGLHEQSHQSWGKIFVREMKRGDFLCLLHRHDHCCPGFQDTTTLFAGWERIPFSWKIERGQTFRLTLWFLSWFISPPKRRARKHSHFQLWTFCRTFGRKNAFSHESEREVFIGQDRGRKISLVKGFLSFFQLSCPSVHTPLKKHLEHFNRSADVL